MVMLPRRALCHLAASVPKTSPHDITQVARVLRRARLSSNASCPLAIRVLYARAPAAHRPYATTAQATKPTATVKKAVKTAAAKKAAPKKTPASKSTAAKSAATKPKAKKPAATNKAPKKKAAKKKVAPKKKPVKKVKTPEEKEKDALSALRVRALKAPVKHHEVRGFNAFVSASTVKSDDSKKLTPDGVRSNLSQAAQAFKELTPAELEHWNHVANEKTAANRAEYKAWIESHTVEQIYDANLARAQLRRKIKALDSTIRKRGYTYSLTNTEKLIDERAATGARSPYIMFTKERWASGDFKGIVFLDANKLISKEWAALTEAEKKKYGAASKTAA